MIAHLTRTPTVAATLATVVALAACGGDSKTDAGGSASPAATSAEAPATAPAAATTTTTDAAVPDDGAAAVTEGGDTLALGTRVVAPYVIYGTKAGTQQNTKLGVTALRVRKGKISDFKGFNLDAKQKATVPYYVEVKYENLGKLKLQRFLMDPSIEDSDGEEYKPLNLVVVGGTFKKCPNPRKERLRAGESFTLCSAVLLPKGKVYERVRFQGDVLKDPYFWK